MVGVNCPILIDLVRERPALWDTRHQQYHNRFVVDKDWNDISAKLGITKEQAKGKWKSLRDCFRRELKKGEATTPTVIKWPFFEKMTFLCDVMETRISLRHFDTATTPYDEEDVVKDEDFTSQRVFDHQYAQDFSESSSTNFLIQNDSDHQPELLPATVTIINSPEDGISETSKSGFKEPADVSRNDGCWKETLIQLEKEKLRLMQNEDADGSMNFFKSILPFMKLLPPIRKLKVRNEIQNILIRELRLLQSLENVKTPQESQKSLPKFESVLKRLNPEEIVDADETVLHEKNNLEEITLSISNGSSEEINM